MCPGSQLMLSCNAGNSSLLQWNVTGFPPLQYLNPGERGTRLFSSGSVSVAHLLPIVTNQTLFNFSITSTFPLTSDLSILNISDEIDLIRIECFDLKGTSLLQTVIHVIGNGGNNKIILMIVIGYREGVVQCQ